MRRLNIKNKRLKSILPKGIAFDPGLYLLSGEMGGGEEKGKGKGLVNRANSLSLSQVSTDSAGRFDSAKRPCSSSESKWTASTLWDKSPSSGRPLVHQTLTLAQNSANAEA
jgi:hypothetical protein